MRIALFCAGGLSTATLVKRILRAAEKKGYTDVVCESFSIGELKEKAQGSDIILLSPQIGFQEKKVREIVPDIPITVINMTDYGLMNGSKVFQTVLNVLMIDDDEGTEAIH